MAGIELKPCCSRRPYFDISKGLFQNRNKLKDFVVPGPFQDFAHRMQHNVGSCIIATIDIVNTSDLVTVV